MTVTRVVRKVETKIPLKREDGAVGVINAVKMWYQRHDANANNSSRPQWKLHNPIGLSVSRHGWSTSPNSQWGSKKLKADHTKASAIFFFGRCILGYDRSNW
jgi:hypothetical protein